MGKIGDKARNFAATVKSAAYLMRNFGEVVRFLRLLVNPEVRIHPLPGSIFPERKTNGAIGFDVGLRAIVSSWEMDPEKPYLRKTLFDFKTMPADPGMRGHVLQERGASDPSELVYRLFPGESVTGGVGFVTAMPFPMFYWDTPRSGLASKWRITLGNAPGTVDPDYRGEAGVVIKNESREAYHLKHNMRIAQCIFSFALIPNLIVVPKYEDLPITLRGAGGFGSTGIR
jgi:dUTP pyrophosphatase